MEWDKNKYLEIIQRTRTIKEIGKITEIIGLTIESDGPKSSIGDLCYIYNDYGDQPTMAEVVGFKKDKILLLRPDDFVLYFGKDENILFEVMVGVSIGSINDIIKYDAILPANIICA